jgi:hypothetical protein
MPSMMPQQFESGWHSVPMALWLVALFLLMPRGHDDPQRQPSSGMAHQQDEDHTRRHRTHTTKPRDSKSQESRMPLLTPSYTKSGHPRTACTRNVGLREAQGTSVSRLRKRNLLAGPHSTPAAPPQPCPRASTPNTRGPSPCRGILPAQPRPPHNPPAHPPASCGPGARAAGGARAACAVVGSSRMTRAAGRVGPGAPAGSGRAAVGPSRVPVGPRGCQIGSSCRVWRSAQLFPTANSARSEARAGSAPPREKGSAYAILNSMMRRGMLGQTSASRTRHSGSAGRADRA